MGNFRLLGLLGLLLLAACNAQKQPAQQAFAQLQASITPVSADLEKYAPEEYAQLNALVSQMKGKLNDGDYEAVLQLRPQAMAQLMAASGLTAQRKQSMTRKLGGDWKELSATVPKLLADLKTRVDTLRSAKQLPSGVTMAAVAQADAQLPSMSGSWSSILELSKSGNLDAAIPKAQELKNRCVQVGSMVGLRLGESVPSH